MFYRATTEETARRLGVTGWVRNLRDGRVELVACGDPGQLAALESWLWTGPAGARVDQVVATDSEDSPEFAGFAIRY